MEQQATSISVIIATFNMSAHVTRALESVVRQTLQPLEIVVVDDCSTDDTCDIVRSYSRDFPKIRLIELDKNGGPARARNMGIAAAQGSWLAVLDADDAWRTDRLEQLWSVATSYGADIIADNQILYDIAADRDVRIGFKAHWKVARLTAADLFANDLPGKSPLGFGGLKPLFRKEFLYSNSLSYDEAERYGEDFKLLAEFLMIGAKALIVSYPGYIYSLRISPSTSQTSAASRSIPRFDRLVATSDFLAQKYRTKIDPRTAEVMRRRRDYLETVHLSNVARKLRQSRNYMTYIRLVITNTRLFHFLLSRLILRSIPKSRFTELSFDTPPKIGQEQILV